MVPHPTWKSTLHEGWEPPAPSPGERSTAAVPYSTRVGIHWSRVIHTARTPDPHPVRPTLPQWIPTFVQYTAPGPRTPEDISSPTRNRPHRLVAGRPTTLLLRPAAQQPGRRWTVPSADSRPADRSAGDQPEKDITTDSTIRTTPSTPSTAPIHWTGMKKTVWMLRRPLAAFALACSTTCSTC